MSVGVRKKHTPASLLADGTKPTGLKNTTASWRLLPLPSLPLAFVAAGGSQLSSQPSRGSLCQCFRNKRILVAKSPWEMLGSSSQPLEPPCGAELPPRFPLSHTGRCALPAPGRAEKELVPLPKKTSSKGRKTWVFLRQFGNGPRLQSEFTQDIILYVCLSNQRKSQPSHA